MIRTHRPAGGRLAAVVIAAAALSACSYTSPITVSTPYAAADGTDGSLTDPATGTTVELRNMLLVSAGKGQPGVLVGAVTSSSGSPTTVKLAVLDKSAESATALTQGPVTVTPGQLTEISFDGGDHVQIASTPVAPGSLLYLAATGSGGTIVIPLPVLAPTPGGPYASITPTPVVTATPTPTESATPSPVASPTPTPSDSAMATSSPTPTASKKK